MFTGPTHGQTRFGAMFASSHGCPQRVSGIFRHHAWSASEPNADRADSSPRRLHKPLTQRQGWPKGVGQEEEAINQIVKISYRTG